MVKSKILKSFLLLTLAFPLFVFAQSDEKQGSIVITSDPRILQLAEDYKRLASQIHNNEGFRIQIFFDSGNFSKRNASLARQEFIRRFPDVEAYITFREPYYRIRVGDFRTKLEADGFRKKLLLHYPHAFTVNDQINPPTIH
jgi:hypothetical protein